jgi:hypothetical protein
MGRAGYESHLTSVARVLTPTSWTV